MPMFVGSALRVSQPIGEFWIAAIPADVLLASTVPDPLRIALDPNAADTDEWRDALRLLGNQRTLERERLRKIARYVDSLESTFPNSIILAATSDGPAVGEADSPWQLVPAEGGGDDVRTLIIPDNPIRAKVVDGQHRLYSFLYSQLEDRKRFSMACAIFMDLPQPMQAMVFATINTNQKAVRRGMALNLYGYNVDDEAREFWSPEKLATFVARRLNYDAISRLRGRIRIEAEGAPTPALLPGASRPVPMAAIVDGVLGLISDNPKRDRDDLRSERFWKRQRRPDLGADGAPAREWYKACRDVDLYELVRQYVGVLDRAAWAAAEGRSMLTRAVGIRALFRFFGEFLRQRAPLPMPPSPQDAAMRAGEAESLLKRVAAVDFSSPFFEATGRGQQRLLVALLVGSGLERLVDQALPEEEMEILAALLRSTIRAQ